MNDRQKIRRTLAVATPLMVCAMLCSCAGAEPPAAGTGTGTAGLKTVSVRLRAISTTALTVASASNTAGNGVTLLATVDGKAGAAPAGSVVFTVQGKRVGQATVANGSASLTVETLPAGFSSLAAEYEGDEHFLPSTSAPVRFYQEERN